MNDLMQSIVVVKDDIFWGIMTGFLCCWVVFSFFEISNFLRFNIKIRQVKREQQEKKHIYGSEKETYMRVPNQIT